MRHEKHKGHARHLDRWPVGKTPAVQIWGLKAKSSEASEGQKHHIYNLSVSLAKWKTGKGEFLS